MSELSSTTDAPPPPPPPPPPEIESREPDASPELAQALSGENQDANQTGFDTGGQDDAARMAQAQEQADPIRQDLSDYQQDPTEVPSGSLVSPDPVSDAGQSVAGSDGGGQDDAARMARAQEQADPIREQLQEYQQDNAVDGGPPDVSPELAEALLAESEPLEAPDAGPEPIVEPDAPLDETPDPTQASADADTESPPSPEADRADGADPVAPDLVESAAEETPETETDSAREQPQEYEQDNAVEGGPPDVSPELA